MLSRPGTCPTSAPGTSSAEKLLESAAIKVSSVLTDLHGVTGRDITGPPDRRGAQPQGSDPGSTERRYGNWDPCQTGVYRGEDQREGSPVLFEITEGTRSPAPHRSSRPVMSASCDATRAALLELAKGLTGYQHAFGARGDVDPVRHLIATASAWGGLPDHEATYLNVEPGLPVGEYQLTVRDVPVDGFWSISVYNSAGYFSPGYFEPNDRGTYSVNNLTAIRGDDGSVTVPSAAAALGGPTACRSRMAGTMSSASTALAPKSSTAPGSSPHRRQRASVQLARVMSGQPRLLQVSQLGCSAAPSATICPIPKLMVQTGSDWVGRDDYCTVPCS